MPCWERRTQTLEMTKADPTVVRDALHALGFATIHDGKTGRVFAERDAGEVIEFYGGKLTITANTQAAIDQLTGQIRRGYTAAAFRTVAAKAGFQVQERPNGQLVAVRRRY